MLFNVYLDDIIIQGEDKESVSKAYSLIIEKLIKEGFAVNKKKCIKPF